MKTMIYPGSFDPITLGHYDIISRASKMTDQLIVAILHNPDKKSYFTMEERMEMIRLTCADLPNVVVDSSDKLTVAYAREKGATAVIRGLRAISDFEYELQWATLNQKLDTEFQALFMMASSEYSFLSSSMVRQIGRFGGDISQMIPPQILDYVKSKLSNDKTK